jgi:threonine aldolase
VDYANNKDLGIIQGPTPSRQVDYENAQFLASELASCPKLTVHPKKVATNIVLANCTGVGFTASELAVRLAVRGVLAHPIARNTIRLVTHRDPNRTQCERAERVIGEVGRPCVAKLVQSSPTNLLQSTKAP